MNKSKFLEILNKELENLPEEDRKDILYDYEEHFRIGEENGKTEEEISASLGDPKTLVREFTASYMLHKAENNLSTGNVFRAVFATISLGFFNIIFVLGPFFAVLGVLIGLFGAAFAITITGAVLFGGTIFAPVFPNVIDITFNGAIHPMVVLSSSIGLTCLGMLFIIGDIYLGMFLYKGTLKYLKMNVRIITGRRAKNE